MKKYIDKYHINSYSDLIKNYYYSDFKKNIPPLNSSAKDTNYYKNIDYQRKSYENFDEPKQEYTQKYFERKRSPNRCIDNYMNLNKNTTKKDCLDCSDINYNKLCETLCDSIPNSCTCDYSNLSIARCGRDIISLYDSQSVNFDILDTDCEIKIDFDLKEKKALCIFGEVRNDCNKPVENIVVTLLRVIDVCSGQEFVQECHTLTNCIGYYEFKVDIKNKNLDYKVIIGQNVK